ncbi:MAG: hypothetical protein AAF804_05555 [Bacteroidota bacterium]
MRLIIFIILTLSLCFNPIHSRAQSSATWFFTPEFSLMLHGDHAGNTVGFQAGVSLLKNHLQVGFFYYGRSGPINGQTYEIALPDGQTYRGKEVVPVRADQGSFGLMLAPQITFQNGWALDFPLNVGQLGAGFYLFGDDRITPDGRRVSAWENELMDGRDAGFSLLFEGGVRLKAPLGKDTGIKAVAGIHHAYAPTWETFVGGTDFYNVPRISLGIQFGG